MLATVHAATLLGVRGHPVRVEVHVDNGLPAFNVVGLPDASCKEARDRVRAALVSSGFAWPSRRITVNLAPTGVHKAGAVLDLPHTDLPLPVARHDVPVVMGEHGPQGDVIEGRESQLLFAFLVPDPHVLVSAA